MLGRETSWFLLDVVKPSVVFSGDDHDYCDTTHRGGVREVTLKSFSSSAGIRRPGFQLLSLVAPDPSTPYADQKTHADRPCFLPDQAGVYYRVYLPLVVLTVLFLVGSNLRTAWQRWTKSSSDAKSRMSPDMKQGEFTPVTRRQSDRMVPASLPTRMSSQTGGLAVTTPTSSSFAARPQRLGPPSDINSRSAPNSPLTSPRLGYVGDGDDDIESGMEASSMSRRPSYINMHGGEDEYGYGSGIQSEPSSYFPSSGSGLSAPMSGMTSRPSSANLSSGGDSTPQPSASHHGMPPTTRRTLPRTLSAADWASAAKAKDKSVLGIMMDSLPVPGTSKRGKAGAVLGWGTVRGFVKWIFKSRNGVLTRSWKEVLAVSWPPAVVWLIVNALFFWS